MTKKLLIIGTSGQSKVVLDCALSEGRYTDIAFLAKDLQIEQVAGFPVYREQDVLAASEDSDSLPFSFMKQFDEVIVAIGNNSIRLDMSKEIVANGIKLATIIHPRAVVSRFAEIQDGTVIFASAVVNPYAKIGMACIINTGAVVEHDCDISNGVHISPNASIAGTVYIGEKSWICIGSCLSNNITVGANSVVGAGSVVLRNILHHALAAGVPAKIKKHYAVTYSTKYRYAEIEDCDLIFEWANDPQTRENSHNKEPIAYENHITWYKKRISSTDNWMFIILRDDMPVGVLRLDKTDDDMLISYSVAREARRKHIGQEIIYMLPEIIKKEKIDCKRIVAEVLKTNIASNRIFLNAGYQKHDNESMYTYISDLEQ